MRIVHIYESTNYFQFTRSPHIVEEQYSAWNTWQTQMALIGQSVSAVSYQSQDTWNPMIIPQASKRNV